jgi:hypothetical protein
MTRTGSIPTDDVLDRVVDDVLPHVLARIRHRPRRRLLHATVIGASMALIAGTAVAATVLLNDPDDGYAHTGGHTAFALDCHSGRPREDGGSYYYATAREAADADRDPIGTCREQMTQQRISDAVGAEEIALQSSGAHCGVIRLTGERRVWSWSVGRDGGVTSTDGAMDPAPTRWAEDCAPHSTAIPAPPPVVGRFAACAHAANWVSVYPTGHSTAAQTCARVGLPPWR